METVEFKENTLHSTVEKRFSYYPSQISDFFPSVSPHWHEEFELNMIKEGSSIFRIGDEEFITASGDIIIIAPNEIHSIYQDGSNLQVYDTIVFSQEAFGFTAGERSFTEYIKPLITGEMRINHLITQKDPLYYELSMILIETIDAAKENHAFADILVKSNFSRLLWCLIKWNYVSLQDSGRATVTGIESMRQVLHYIAMNYRQDITINQLARMTGRSKSSYMSCFRKAIGITTIDYILQIRIKAACDLLQTTDRTVLDVSMECGFKNLSNFNRHFKRITGISPREYKRKRCSIVK